MLYNPRRKFIFAKVFLAALLVWYCTKCHAQNPPQKVNADYQFKGVGSDSVNRLPKRVSHYNLDSGAIAYNGPDSNLYVWTGHQWKCETCSNSPSANNGLRTNSTTIEMGEPVAQSGNPAKLLSNREIPSNGFRLLFLDSLNTSPTKSFLSIWDTVGQFGGQFTPTPLKIRNNKAGGYFYTFLPTNYGKTYNTVRAPSGHMTPGFVGYGYAQQASLDSMPDNVYDIFTYNENPSSGRVDTSEAAARIGFETNFLNSVGGLALNFEYHNPEVTVFDGTPIRITSDYINKTSGFTQQDNIIDDIFYYDVARNKSSLSTPYIHIHSSVGGTGTFGEIEFTSGGSDDVGSILFNGSAGQPNWGIGAGDGNFAISSSDIGNAVLLQANGNLLTNRAGGSLSVGTDNPDASAKVDISSTTKGFLMPRMTTAQRLSVSSPASGLQVYDTDVLSPFFFDGTSWVKVSPQPINGNASASLTGGSSVVVTFGSTIVGGYRVNATAQNALSSAPFYITSKTSTTFTIQLVTPATGTVSFDWEISQ